MAKKVPPYHCTQPCSNCPYRTDSPLQLWGESEYQKLLKYEDDFMGATYSCHKKNGSMCIGWLMKQDEHGLPSLTLRISLSKHNVTREYLDSLKSPAPLYKNIKDMIKANYPHLLKVTMKKSLSLSDKVNLMLEYKNLYEKIHKFECSVEIGKNNGWVTINGTAYRFTELIKFIQELKSTKEK